MFNYINFLFFILISVEQLLYKYANVMQQLDSSSCGFFTIPYAIDIAFGIDPKKSKCIYHKCDFSFEKIYKKHNNHFGYF